MFSDLEQNLEREDRLVSVVLKFAMILFWAAILPWVGFWLLCIRLAGLPLIVFIFSPYEWTVILYQAGFVPSLIPAAVFVLLKEKIGGWAALLLAMLASAASAIIWWDVILLDEPRLANFSYGSLSILVITFLAPMIMSLSLIKREPKKKKASPSFFTRLEDKVFSNFFDD